MKEKKHHLKGVEYLKKGKYNEALRCFNQALEINPDYCDCLTDRAIAYFYLKKNELSIIDLDRAVYLEPQNPFRYSSRAYIKEKIGDNYGAMEDYKKAIELDPDDAIAYNNLGLIEEKLGYMNSAKINFQKADSYFHMQNYSSPEALNNRSEKNKKEYIKAIFKSKSSLKEFIRFIFNGFKLKK
jgi:tetratricopeptide (TPR) repeat protein